MATEIADGVWRFELRAANAYLVVDDVPTLVDAGTPWDADAIRSEFEDAGVAVADVGRVLLTHYDLDHVGTLASLTPDLDAPVYAYGFDAQLLCGARSPPLRNHKGLIQRLGGLLTDRPDLDVVGVRDGETVGSFTAYHTPGHTPGHVAYVSEALGVALLGDLVSESDGDLDPSEWLISYDTGEVLDSIRGLAERAPPFEVACIGHGDPITSGGSEALAALARRI
ncbi:metallo-beta-lactamase superfamily protein [Halorubrum californiense DSM 19288]|uniref:Metallo-beta-lactamase superfamily protein n=1 Tax=Halorubrum californiense DSM 19288 TaxID=1227465 RepID=M0EBI3_9EURY|nr:MULTISPECIES: MBL fold metallo-hydrolase [Halorubrum]ELZ44398.1 metallo-beta-lactamase superfamily protein [Halorubrum californiense DSM 19288]TKX71961.1 MBL fold metallo-hydrolase [Halorubrum sp. GN11GM_10-3_MGM]